MAHAFSTFFHVATSNRDLASIGKRIDFPFAVVIVQPASCLETGRSLHCNNGAVSICINVLNPVLLE
jgi:hypothetical protein